MSVEQQLDQVLGGLQIITERLDHITERLGQIEVRLDQVDGRLDQVEVRLDQVDGRLGQIEVRLGQVDGRLDRVDERLDKVEALLGQLETRFNQLEDRARMDHQLANARHSQFSSSLQTLRADMVAEFGVVRAAMEKTWHTTNEDVLMLAEDMLDVKPRLSKIESIVARLSRGVN